MDAAAHVAKAAASLLEVVANLVDLLHRLLLNVTRVLAAAVVAVAAAAGKVVVADLVELLALAVVARLARALLLLRLGRRDAVATLVEARIVIAVEEAAQSECQRCLV